MRRPSLLRSLSSVGLLSPFLLLACIPDGDSDDATADAGRQEDGGTDTDAGTVELTQFARDMLEAHNAARAAAQPTPSPALEPLTWDPTVEETARKWVEQCQFKHNDDRGNAGENIAAATPDYLNAKAVVKGWVDEAADYDYSKNTCKAGEQCGHYTQVVWRNTRRLGCATKRCTVNSPFSGASTWDFWVCNYAPPGNYVGQRPY
ncbi:CAP domain-containing protein [Corallococcus sp. RDP092CA]|uniref:CAP domain-containing protein n=1 Tax=Corallococcus sp. RDP092CA TaxID=3109369 RepID=UPI0035B3538A